MNRRIWQIGLIAFFCILFMKDFYDFASSDPMHYYSQDKSRLLVVAGIGVMGGLIAHLFSRLSTRNGHRVKLCALGLAACFFTIFAGYFSFSLLSTLQQAGQLQLHLGLGGILKGFLFIACLPLAISIFFWVYFVRTLKRHVE